MSRLPRPSIIASVSISSLCWHKRGIDRKQRRKQIIGQQPARPPARSLESRPKNKTHAHNTAQHSTSETRRLLYTVLTSPPPPPTGVVTPHQPVNRGLVRQAGARTCSWPRGEPQRGRGIPGRWLETLNPAQWTTRHLLQCLVGSISSTPNASARKRSTRRDEGGARVWNDGNGGQEGRGGGRGWETRGQNCISRKRRPPFRDS